ncbi:FixH family protein [Roseibium sp.]|uniref:FixH family protein n=1 Tax=Roseibium sp. TaxID=1936156 RepID=UPI003A982F1C
MMNSGMTNSGQKPFTGRTVLFWLLGFFAVIFTANAIFIWLAIGSFPGVVVESSYKAGQAYNQEIADARAQSERGWQVGADLERGADGTAFVKVDARDKGGAPLTGLAFKALLNHPTHEGEDVIVELNEGQSGVYSGSAGGLKPGNWNVVIEAERGDKRVFRSENRIFLKD